METTGVIATDAGLFGMWAPAAFAGVVDYDTWEDMLLEDEDIARHIAAGAFVPINIGADCASQVLARIGTETAPAVLTERESLYRFISSEEYLFVSDGTAVISGLEHVGDDTDVGFSVPVPAGRWTVTISLIGWDDEPGQTDDQGRPKPTALPDFVLLLNPVHPESGPYRTKVQTFDRPQPQEDPPET